MQHVFTITVRCNPADETEVANVVSRAVDDLNEALYDPSRTDPETGELGWTIARVSSRSSGVSFVESSDPTT